MHGGAPTVHNSGMRALVGGFLVVGLALSVVGCGTAPVDPAPVASRGPAVAVDAPRVVFLGDSLTAGFGLAEQEAFPAIVGELLAARGTPIEVVNAGVSGDTSAGGLARLDWVLTGAPAVVVVELGANDGLRGQPLPNTEANLREIVRRVRDMGSEVVLTAMDIPTSYGAQYASGFAAMYPRIADDLDAVLIPRFLHEVIGGEGLMQADGIHPTAEGHRVLAEAVARGVAEALSRRAGRREN